MVRVLYLSATARVGGAEESLLTLLRHLDRDRVDPVLACPPSVTAAGAPGAERGGSPQTHEDLPGRAEALGVPCVRLPLRRLKRMWNPFRLADAWRGLTQSRRACAACVADRSIDLIHANSATAALQAGGAPVLCHLRDLRLPRLAAWRLRSTVAMAIAASEAVAAVARQRIGPRVRRIPNGVDPDLFRPGRAQGGEAPYLLMIGHMVPWKRHDRFLECLAEVRARDATLQGVIVGGDVFGDQPGYIAHLMELARDLGLHHALTWKERVGREALADLIAGASVLVHPTPDEPFGRAVMEAMACATPVVAVNAGGPRELLADGGGVLVAAGDVEGMAAAVLDHVQHPEHMRLRGQRGRQIVLERYTASAHARAVEALYDELHSSGSA